MTATNEQDERLLEKWRWISEGCQCEHPSHKGYEHTQQMTGCPACDWCHDDALTPFTNAELKRLVAQHTKEAERRARYDELWTYIAGRKNIYASSVYQIEGQDLVNRLSELAAPTTSPQQPKPLEEK